MQNCLEIVLGKRSLLLRDLWKRIERMLVIWFFIPKMALKKNCRAPTLIFANILHEETWTLSKMDNIYDSFSCKMTRVSPQIGCKYSDKSLHKKTKIACRKNCNSLLHTLFAYKRCAVGCTANFIRISFEQKLWNLIGSQNRKERQKPEINWRSQCKTARASSKSNCLSKG